MLKMYMIAIAACKEREGYSWHVVPSDSTSSLGKVAGP